MARTAGRWVRGHSGNPARPRRPQPDSLTPTFRLERGRVDFFCPCRFLSSNRRRCDDSSVSSSFRVLGG